MAISKARAVFQNERVLLSTADCCQNNWAAGERRGIDKIKQVLQQPSVGSFVHGCEDDQGVGLFDCFI